jgi:hypothetical protein
MMDEEQLPAPLTPGGQIVIYRDGATNLQVRLDGQTVWLAQAAMPELFQTTKQNASLHVQNILEEGELQGEAVVKEYLTTAAGGKLDGLATCKEYLQVRQEGARHVRRSLTHYNLDTMLA